MDNTPELTDDEIMRVVVSASDSLNITRVHELGGKTRTIMDEAGVLETARAIERAVLDKLRQGGEPVASDAVHDAVERVQEWATEKNVKAFPRTACAHIDGLSKLLLASGRRTSADLNHPVFAFLLGEGALRGVEFGDRHPEERGAYWWREDLRAALASAPAAGEAVTDEMIQAGAKAAREYFERTGGNSPAVIYKAMRAAAPQTSADARNAARYCAIRECPSLVMSLGLLSGGSDLDARTDAYLADEKRGAQ